MVELEHYLDMLELKHVSLNKCISDILIGPGDKELVVVVGLATGIAVCIYKSTPHSLHVLCIMTYLLCQAC